MKDTGRIWEQPGCAQVFYDGRQPTRKASVAEKEHEKADVKTALTSDSIAASMAGVRSIGATVGRRVYRDKKDNPIAAVIFVVDPDACKDVLEAMDKLDAKWAEEAKEGGDK